MQLVITTNITENVFSEIASRTQMKECGYPRGTIHDLMGGENQTAPYFATMDPCCFSFSCAQLLYSGPIFRSTLGGSNPEVGQRGQLSP